MDIQRLQEKIDELESYLHELDMLLPDYERAYLDLRTKRACEKTFELACETVIDVCNIIIAQKGFGKPVDNKDSVNNLVKNAVISESLGDQLKDMIGFQNLLVHQYGKVDDRRAFNYLSNERKDFFEFITAINEFIKDKKE